jgi:hypothetical protein
MAELCSGGNAVVETPRRLYRKLLDATTTVAAGDKAQDDLAIGNGWPFRRNMSESLVSPRVRFLSPARSAHKRQDELPKVAAGWPLLRKEIKSALQDSSEVSVVQWAMNLPTRWSLASSEQMVPVPEELVVLREKYSSKYTVFSYSELAKITDNFSPGMFPVSMSISCWVFSSRMHC